MSENASGIEPRGVAVLLRPYEIKTKAGLIIPKGAQERDAMVNLRAEVVDIGPVAWHDEVEPRAKIGDHVMVTQYAGMLCVGPRDGKQYRLVNDRDIFCRIQPMEEVTYG